MNKRNRKPLPKKIPVTFYIDPDDKPKIHAIGGTERIRELIVAEYIRMDQAGEIDHSWIGHGSIREELEHQYKKITGNKYIGGQA